MIIYYVYHVRKHPFLMFRLSISSYSNHKRHQPNIRDGWSLIHSPELLTMTLAKTDSYCWHEFEGKEAGRQMDILIPFFYQHSFLPIIVGTPMSGSPWAFQLALPTIWYCIQTPLFKFTGVFPWTSYNMMFFAESHKTLCQSASFFAPKSPFCSAPPLRSNSSKKGCNRWPHVMFDINIYRSPKFIVYIITYYMFISILYCSYAMYDLFVSGLWLRLVICKHVGIVISSDIWFCKLTTRA